MKLITHLQQGKLLFLQDQGFRLTIEENQHFRWMSFNGVPQSVMHLRQPHWLTLPHHFFLILPLAFITPNRIVEVGLGGGNLSRYLCTTLPEVILTSFESAPSVIDCFTRFFSPIPLLNHRVILQNTSTELFNITRDIDWFIYDVFSTTDNNGIELKTVTSLLNKIENNTWLTLNLPNLSPNKLDFVLRQLQKHLGQNCMYYFFVPYYKNIIVHIGSTTNTKKASVLPRRTSNRLYNLWQHACLDRQLKSDRTIV